MGNFLLLLTEDDLALKVAWQILGKIPCIDYLVNFLFCWFTVAILNAGNTAGVLISVFQILLIPV